MKCWCRQYSPEPPQKTFPWDTPSVQRLYGPRCTDSYFYLERGRDREIERQRDREIERQRDRDRDRDRDKDRDRDRNRDRDRDRDKVSGRDRYRGRDRGTCRC